MHMCHVDADAGYAGVAVKEIFSSTCFAYTATIAVERPLPLVVFVEDALSAKILS